MESGGALRKVWTEIQVNLFVQKNTHIINTTNGRWDISLPNVSKSLTWVH